MCSTAKCLPIDHIAVRWEKCCMQTLSSITKGAATGSASWQAENRTTSIFLVWEVGCALPVFYLPAICAEWQPCCFVVLSHAGFYVCAYVVCLPLVLHNLLTALELLACHDCSTGLVAKFAAGIRPDLPQQCSFLHASTIARCFALCRRPAARTVARNVSRPNLPCLFPRDASAYAAAEHNLSVSRMRRCSAWQAVEECSWSACSDGNSSQIATSIATSFFNSPTLRRLSLKSSKVWEPVPVSHLLCQPAAKRAYPSESRGSQ